MSRATHESEPQRTIGPRWTTADASFVRALEDCSLPSSQFHHRDHVRLAWLYLDAEPLARAERRMETAIRRYAGHLGAHNKYHQTLTLAWMRLVDLANAATPGAGTFEAFIDGHPALLDVSLVGRYYSQAAIDSLDAREGWVAPDLHGLTLDSVSESRRV